MSISSAGSSLRSWPAGQALASGRPVTASSDSLHRVPHARSNNYCGASNFSEFGGRSESSLHLANVLEWDEPTDYEGSAGERSFPVALASDDGISHPHDDMTAAFLGSFVQEHSKLSALSHSWRVADSHIEKMVRTLQRDEGFAAAAAPPAAAASATTAAPAAATAAASAAAAATGAAQGKPGQSPSTNQAETQQHQQQKIRPRPKSSTSSSCACRAMLGVGRVKKPMPALQRNRDSQTSSPNLLARSNSGTELRSVVKNGVVHVGGHHKYRAKAHRGHPFWEPQGPIHVHLHFHETNDRLTVQVDPKMWLDSDDGEMVIDNEVHACSWEASQQPPTLKGIIERLSGIPPDKQRLFCNKNRVEGCGLSLLDCGIRQESVVHIRSKQDASCKDRDKVVLASASRRLARDEAWASQRRFRSPEPSDHWAQDPDRGWGVAQSAGRARSEGRLLHEEEQREDSKCRSPLQPSQDSGLHKSSFSIGNVKVMPQWQPSSQLKFFGTTHKGLDFHGDSHSLVHMFGDYHPYRPVEDDRYFGRVRGGLTYTTPIEYE